MLPRRHLRIMECNQTRLVTFRQSSSFAVAVEYTLGPGGYTPHAPAGLTETTKGLDALLVRSCPRIVGCKQTRLLTFRARGLNSLAARGLQASI